MDDRQRGGQPAARRLLELARRELLETLLPQLQGDARYRARLIANALKIARHELEAGGAEEAAILRQLAELAAATLVASRLPPDTCLSEALRGGALDGDPAVHGLLVRLTEARRAAVG